MAMLAEKKRKEKWCLNPMGNYWAKDESKFGQKLLEKMGWQPGTGLGVRGQGPTDIIKISVKNDTLGLGSKHDNQKEIWTKNLVDYDSLLAELNGESKTEERQPEVLPSLEEKSKTSRARVHYHKFTRGKDVSRYSSKDLNCILPLHKVKQDEKPATAENNMYAYFSKKSNNPYKNDYGNESLLENAPDELPLSMDHQDEVLQGTSEKNKKRKILDLERDNESLDVEKTKKKKKSKGSLGLPESKANDILFTKNVENNYIDSNSIGSNVIENDTPTKISKKKKKKKKKHSKNDEIMNELS